MSNINCLVWEITLKCNDQINDVGIKNVNIIGGELFLRPDWKKIIKRLSKYGITIYIVTNGICLNRDNLHFLYDNGIKTIGISIDGGKPETHNYIRQVPNLFEQIFKNIENNDTPISFTAITTLNKLNYKEMDILLENLTDSKFRVWEVQTASPHGRMSKNIALSQLEYYFTGIKIAQARQTVDKEKLAIVCNHDYGYYSDFIPRITIYDKWLGCPAGKTTLGIKYNGDIQGCLSLDYEKFKEISLHKHDLKSIIEDDKYFCWNHNEERCKKLSGYCKVCKYSNVCMGGCSDVAHSYTGNIAENPHCFYLIEQLYKNKEYFSDFDKIFNLMINGKIEKGKIILADNQYLSKEIIDNYNLSEKEKELFNYIL